VTGQDHVVKRLPARDEDDNDWNVEDWLLALRDDGQPSWVVRSASNSKKFYCTHPSCGKFLSGERQFNVNRHIYATDKHANRVQEVLTSEQKANAIISYLVRNERPASDIEDEDLVRVCDRNQLPLSFRLLPPPPVAFRKTNVLIRALLMQGVNGTAFRHG
jgi:hypothetical protein